MDAAPRARLAGGENKSASNGDIIPRPPPELAPRAGGGDINPTSPPAPSALVPRPSGATFSSTAVASPIESARRPSPSAAFASCKVARPRGDADDGDFTGDRERSVAGDAIARARTTTRRRAAFEEVIGSKNAQVIARGENHGVSSTRRPPQGSRARATRRRLGPVGGARDRPRRPPHARVASNLSSDSSIARARCTRGRSG